MTSLMTSRERVRAALRHKRPDRVPFAVGFGPTAEMTAVLTRELATRGLDWPALCDAAEDVRRIGWPPLRTGPAPENPDIWGIRRAETAYGGGAYDEIVHYPLAGVTSPAALRDYPWPVADAFDAGYPAAYARAHNPGHAKAFRIPGGNPFETYCWMTGLEEAICNLLEQPEVVAAAMGRITDFYVDLLAAVLREGAAEIDLILFADDLGSQTGLLLSRALYREFIQPSHRRLAACAAELAPEAARMIHSDGAVFDVLPDLIDAGFTVFEAVQTDAAGMDPARLKAAYGDALAFHGGISVQGLLPHADAATVRAEVERLVGVLGAGGGYIAAPAHSVQVGTPVDNVLAMLQGVFGDDGYAALLAAARR
jgi:uroporphyrinogen decarboxylase